MMVDLFNTKNEKTGTIEVPDAVFGAPWRPALVKQVAEAALANRRRPWAHTKGRGEVSGGGRKPWRQKGTGRARHGSIRSPLWRKGGVTHGPTSARDYFQKINKKMKQIALSSVLSRKLKDGELQFFETLATPEPKTKHAHALLKNLALRSPQKRAAKVILVPAPKEAHLPRAARNLPLTKVLPPEQLNVVDLLSFRHVCIDQGAVPVIAKRFASAP
jgi:large subunit ribosomal protein L4